MCGYLLASLERALQANYMAPTEILLFKALKYLKHLILLFFLHISQLKFSLNLPSYRIRQF